MRIIAPLPDGDSRDAPYKLIAVTFANMEDPHYKLNGLVSRVAMGT